MSYSAQTFVADEQPTTAKWNLLWSNDASFNDGTGFADSIIDSRMYADGSIDGEHISTTTSWDWSDWTPTFTASGSMTITSVVINVARYRQIGKTIHFIIDAGYTLGGTTSNSVYFTLPSACNLVANYQPVGAGFLDGVTAWAQMNNTTTSVITRRYDGGNLSLGAGKVSRYFGFYEAD